MPSQGPTGPPSVSNNADFGDVAWTNPNNAVSSDDSRASAIDIPNGQATQLLTAYNFGFSVPSDMTMTGWSVDIEGYSGPSSGNSVIVYLHKTTGGYQGYASGTSFPHSSEGTITIGGSSNMFGTTWTPAQANAATFGISIQIYNTSGATQTVNIDTFTITAHYVAGGVAYSQSRRMQQYLVR